MKDIVSYRYGRDLMERQWTYKLMDVYGSRPIKIDKGCVISIYFGSINRNQCKSTDMSLKPVYNLSVYHNYLMVNVISQPHCKIIN